MPTQWLQLIRLLAEQAPGIVPYWRMKNGTEFHFAIPDRDHIRENNFSPECDFPFTLDEVASLTIQPVVGPPRMRITNDLDAARRAVSSAGGLTCEEVSGDLVVRPDEPAPGGFHPSDDPPTGIGSEAAAVTRGQARH
jgi:hypothetical protein